MARRPLSIGGASPAFTFVLMMGTVDFFGDTTYSGGASMNGPFLASLGAGAAGGDIGLWRRRSFYALVAFAIVVQLLSLPMFVLA